MNNIVNGIEWLDLEEYVSSIVNKTLELKNKEVNNNTKKINDNKKEVNNMSEKNNIKLSYNQFEKILKKIVKVSEFSFGMYELANKYGCLEEFCLDNIPSVETECIDLLEKIMNDNSEWISYWIYELNCGKHNDCTITENYVERKVSIKTIEELYDFLIGNPNYID